MGSAEVSTFYKSPDTVARYEQGRAARVHVERLPAVVSMLKAAGELDQLPLYALFDWLYSHRLRRLSLDLLGSEILDLGCGTSYVYRALLAEGWTGMVAGVDNSEAMLAEGTRQLRQMRRYQPGDASADKGLFRYQDAMGRFVIDIAPPHAVIDQDSLSFLLRRRQLGDAAALPPSCYRTVTSFSGPFCFYPLEEQEELVKHACARADLMVSLQFKNIAFARINDANREMSRIAGVVAHVLDLGIRDSLAFLKSIRFRSVGSRTVGPTRVKHEVGSFYYYPVPSHLVRKWLRDAGFEIVRIGSMGFISQFLYELASTYYSAARGNPQKLARLFGSLAGIDEYFCQDALLGDNLQITAVRTAAFRPAALTYRSAQTFRSAYKVRG